MGGGILEVLLVNAEGITHTNLVGTPSYYVIIECGTQVHRSKASSGEDDNAWWNEKFSFEFPWSGWKNLTHLKLTIMDKEFLTDGGFVGGTIIHLGGIITEGTDSGFLEVKPAPYNVVLEDDTYKGLIRIGFKFIANKEAHAIERRGHIAEENEPRKWTCNAFVKLWRISWGKFLCFRKQRGLKNKLR
ncbi:elicitor-responsive protein 3 [Corylus avellana]|uniref:elicitor-responsive protein 3 n=1 Tax=Corylus avellana TaxID=13451 RepID=UPI00286D60BC|nr:elicitor-responsive protein 3 [Corylus avellana]